MNLSSSETSDTTLLQSAGKVLSQRNASRIKSALETLVEMMMDAKVLSEDDLRSMLQEDSEPEPEPEIEEEVQAGKFKLDVQYLTWSDRLSSILNIFKQRFETLHYISDSALYLEDGQTRTGVQQEIISDLSDVLSSLSQDYPAVSYEDSIFPTMASSAEEVLSEESEGGTHVIAFDCPVARTEIAASSQDNNTEYNKRPIQGVLFRIDEPSDAIPAVGPGLPLYIPLSVAEQTVACVCGLPLDAHDSLSQHANTEIAGVIQSAEIKGNDYCITGYVWPWSQSQKVQAISQNIDRLGMSMNAAARGHKAEIDGKPVFYVDSLQLLGANILYSDRATFKKTRLVAAEALENSGVLITASTALSEVSRKRQHSGRLGNKTNLTLSDLGLRDVGTNTAMGIAKIDASALEESLSQSDHLNFDANEQIAASAEDSDDQPSVEIGVQETLNEDLEEKMSQEILAQLSALSNSVNSSMDEFKNSMSRVNEKHDALAAQFQEFREDLNSRRAAIQASEKEQQRIQEQRELATAIQEAVNKAMNPSGTPARKTYSVAASSSAATQAPANYEIDLQLAAVEGEMRALQLSNSTNPRILELLDEKRRLEHQKQ